MKTSKTIKSLAALSLIFFMSVNSSIAKPFTIHTGDIVNTAVKKQISANEANLSKTITAGETEFNYLRFDVDNFISESAVSELPAWSTDYLRFDVNNFIDANETEITEIPASTEFNYLHFDVNTFTSKTNTNFNEMPVNEFDYLRFDVNKYSRSTAGKIDELPV
jgi:hypothetical protein